jgi:hypothetical protein
MGTSEDLEFRERVVLTTIESVSRHRVPSSSPTLTGWQRVLGSPAVPASGGGGQVASTVMPVPLGGSSGSTGPPVPALSLTRQPGGWRSR